MTDDIVARLRSLNRCIRCGCQSCTSGFENHDHICTDGPGCVQPLERRLRSAIVLAGQAADRLEAAEARVRELEAELAAMETRAVAADLAVVKAARVATAETIERAAATGYRVCAETRHVTLGDKVATAIRQLAQVKHEAE